MTKDSEEAILVSAKELEQVMCIQYPIIFPGGITQDGLALDLLLALFHSNNEVNAMYLAFIKILGLVI